jgi:hypothetical protein
MSGIHVQFWPAKVIPENGKRSLFQQTKNLIVNLNLKELLTVVAELNHLKIMKETLWDLPEFGLNMKIFLDLP